MYVHTFPGLRLLIQIYDPFLMPSLLTIGGGDGGGSEVRQKISTTTSVAVSLRRQIMSGAAVGAAKITQGDEIVQMTETKVGSQVFTGFLATFRYVGVLIFISRSHAFYE